MDNPAAPRGHSAPRNNNACSFIEDDNSIGLPESLVTSCIRLRKGETLFRSGDPFTAIYSIRAGMIKTVTPCATGLEQVAGFHLAGEVIGVEGLGNEAHDHDAIALDYSSVGVMPILRVKQRAREDRLLQRQLYRLLSSAIVYERGLGLMLGTMRAEQRVASFLLELGERYARCGYSSTEFVLRMTREEIGSHLGLKLETISRLLSRFVGERFISAEGRVIRILDPMALRQLVHPD
jgi:CRP/FNR family transcriptional regulator